MRPFVEFCETVRNKFPDKIEMFSLAESLINKQYFNNNPRFFLYVDLDDEKLRGRITTQMRDEAIEEYLSLNFIIK